MPISRGALYGDRTCLGRGRVETDPDGGWGSRETHPTSLRYARSKSHGSHRLEHSAKDRSKEHYALDYPRPSRIGPSDTYIVSISQELKGFGTSCYLPLNTPQCLICALGVAKTALARRKSRLFSKTTRSVADRLSATCPETRRTCARRRAALLEDHRRTRTRSRTGSAHDQQRSATRGTDGSSRLPA